MVQYVSGTNYGHGQRHAQRQLWYKKPLILFTRETPYHIFIFPAGRARAARAPPRYLRQINSAILKVPDAAWNCYARIPGCRRTVPMEPPMSNSSMPHREPIKWNPWYAYNPAGGFLYYSSICKETRKIRKVLFTRMFWERLTTEFDFGLARHWQKSCL